MCIEVAAGALQSENRQYRRVQIDNAVGILSSSARSLSAHMSSVAGTNWNDAC
jgi:hypothetical protein